MDGIRHTHAYTYNIFEDYDISYTMESTDFTLEYSIVRVIRYMNYAEFRSTNGLSFIFRNVQLNGLSNFEITTFDCVQNVLRIQVRILKKNVNGNILER